MFYAMVWCSPVDVVVTAPAADRLYAGKRRAMRPLWRFASLGGLLGLAAATVTQFQEPQLFRSRSMPSWRKGDLVTHPARPEWGTGKLTADGNDERVQVRFQSGGDRVLAPLMAKLVRVPSE